MVLEIRRIVRFLLILPPRLRTRIRTRVRDRVLVDQSGHAFTLSLLLFAPLERRHVTPVRGGVQEIESHRARLVHAPQLLALVRAGFLLGRVDGLAEPAVGLLASAEGDVVGVADFRREGEVTEFAGGGVAGNMKVFVGGGNPVVTESAVVPVETGVNDEFVAGHFVETGAAGFGVGTTVVGAEVFGAKVVEVPVGNAGKVAKDRVVKDKDGAAVREFVVLGKLEFGPGPRAAVDGVAPLVDAVDAPRRMQVHKRLEIVRTRLGRLHRVPQRHSHLLGQSQQLLFAVSPGQPRLSLLWVFLLFQHIVHPHHQHLEPAPVTRPIHILQAPNILERVGSVLLTTTAHSPPPLPRGRHAVAAPLRHHDAAVRVARRVERQGESDVVEFRRDPAVGTGLEDEGEGRGEFVGGEIEECERARAFAETRAAAADDLVAHGDGVLAIGHGEVELPHGKGRVRKSKRIRAKTRARERLTIRSGG